MNWLLLATGGQFLNAIVAILDKYIVTDEKALPRPFVYAFYSCIVTSFWVIIYILAFIPGLADLGAPSLANVQIPSIEVVGMSFLAAYTFFMALVSMYDALRSADASDVMPVVGAVSALASFGMTYFLLPESTSTNFIWGASLLVVGTLLVSQLRFTRNVAMLSVHSGIFFALHYIAMKGLFSATSFDDGFFWSRIAFVLFALSLLLVPAYYGKVTEETKKVNRKSGILVLFTKVLAGVAAFMLLKATDFGEVAVVQAMDGLKFAFIILISILFGRFIPDSAGENDYDTQTILRKVALIILITIGYVMLFTV